MVNCDYIQQFARDATARRNLPEAQMSDALGQRHSHVVPAIVTSLVITSIAYQVSYRPKDSEKPDSTNDHKNK